MTEVVHILHYGMPRCKFSSALPCDWPEGHLWVGFDDVRQATCQACIRNVPLTHAERIVLSAAPGHSLSTYGPDSVVHDLIKRGLLTTERRWWLFFKIIRLTWAGEIATADAPKN